MRKVDRGPKVVPNTQLVWSLVCVCMCVCVCVCVCVYVCVCACTCAGVLMRYVYLCMHLYVLCACVYSACPSLCTHKILCYVLIYYLVKCMCI